MKKNILIVDDNFENLNLLINILEQEDYKIRPAKNCKLAIQSMEKEMPDLILMDVMLPDINGYEACRIIKENDRYKNIPIIFISALDEVFDKIKAFLMGAVDYITKPFNNEEVKIRIKTHLDVVIYQKTLEQKNLLLENANKELELFVFFVSHDLRAPLRHVVGFTQFLSQELNKNLNEKSKKYLENILESTKLMENLIEDLLTLSRIGKNKINYSKVNLNKIIENSIDLMSEELKNRKIKWKIATIPVICVDQSLIREVVMNLISNSIKYTKNKRTAMIEIGFKEDTDKTTVFIKDNGAGFSMNYYEKLFIPFQRLHDRKDFEGTGIGLSLVKKIIIMHKGEVWAEGNPGKGAIFYFSIPKNNNI